MKRMQIDWILFACAGILLVFGLLMIFGISASFSRENFGKTYWFLSHQLLAGIIPGIILGFVAFKIKIKNLKKLALPLFVINLILLYLVFIPKIGLSKEGGKRWLGIGNLSFQPSEFLKITLFVYLAAWLQNKKGKSWKNLAIFLAILAPVAVALKLQPHISALILLLATSFIIYFLAETQILHTFLALAAGIALAFFLITSASYRMERFLVFLKPDLDPMKMGYQIKQAQIAIGSGGLIGKGLGMSKQKFGLLPHPMSDSIFAIICEETGLLGGLLIIVLFLIFFIRGIKISQQAKDKFSKLLAAAISCQIILQAFLNIGSMTGILPLTGVPLPFISYGGTHLITELIGVGILLNISKS